MKDSKEFDKLLIGNLTNSLTKHSNNALIEPRQTILGRKT